jgi:hypothetical protein
MGSLVNVKIPRWAEKNKVQVNYISAAGRFRHLARHEELR